MLFISRFSSFYIVSQWCIRYTQCIFSHTKHTRTLISLDFDILVDCLVLFWFGDNPLTFSIRFIFLGVVSLCYQKPHNFSVCSFYSREILNAVIYFIRQKKSNINAYNYSVFTAYKDKNRTSEYSLFTCSIVWSLGESSFVGFHWFFGAYLFPFRTNQQLETANFRPPN